MKPRLKESRRHRRIPAALRIWTHCSSDAFPAHARDLSCSGFAIDTAQPLPPGTRASFSIELPHGGSLQLEGVVAWSCGGGDLRGMGVCIEDASPVAREQFEALVDRLIKDADRL